MRTFSSGQISVSIAVLVAAFVLGTVVVPDEATAREPEYEMVTSSDGGGGMSGGGEWRTESTNNGIGLPADNDRTPGHGQKYSQAPDAEVDTSWAAKVEDWYIRLLKAVSAVFVQKYF